MQFSEESKLLITNWDACQDILKAERRLRLELSKTLLSLEDQLKKCTWWNKKWRFTQPDAGQVYIWHEDWAKKDTPLIWIGIEGLHPERLFGDDGPPELYVWVSTKQATVLIEKLRSIFIDKGTAGQGQVERRAGNGYVVRKALPTCLPEDIDRFDSLVSESVCSFLEFYAIQQSLFMEAVTAYLKKPD